MHSIPVHMSLVELVLVDCGLFDTIDFLQKPENFPESDKSLSSVMFKLHSHFPCIFKF